ncbi:aldo/keto reductase family protein [Streptococcus halichoeri]|uniref:aldo/keto reductase family protein n=1 Tax=Streptococcus halichoeri TaxID=254785 RepID=UPI00135C7E4D|nr:aldo/keto reductase [Streptococcus halichoeri]
MDDYIKLRTGLSLPQLGFSTFGADDQMAEPLVLQALKLGYRYVATAQTNGNLVGVGRGLFLSGLPREEIVVSSIIHPRSHHYDQIIRSFNQLMNQLGLETLDVLLLPRRSPVTLAQSFDHYYYTQAWKAFEDLYRRGRVGAIGVVDFSLPELEALMANAVIAPHVLHTRIHVGYIPEQVLSFCQDQQIGLVADAPIAHGLLLENPFLEAIAAHYEVSTVQLCLRYLVQKGIVALPRTSNPCHLFTNKTLQFDISHSDMALLEEFNLFIEKDNRLQL